MELAKKRYNGGDLRSILATRRGTLLIAVASAAVAAIILIYAITQYQHGVAGSNQQETVLVANGVIQKGTSGATIAASRLYTPTPIAAKNVSTGAIFDAAALQGKVVASDIQPGEQLTAADFAPSVGVVGQLASNQRAVEVQLDASHGLGGVLQAGDRVDVYGGFNVQSAGPGNVSGPLLRLLVPNVLVLQASGSGGGAGGGNTNVLLAVNVNQAAEVAFASDNGKLWLALRPGNAQNPTQLPTTLGAILAGIPPVAVNPSNGGKTK